jgi:hypothetical protein
MEDSLAYRRRRRRSVTKRQSWWEGKWKLSRLSHEQRWRRKRRSRWWQTGGGGLQNAGGRLILPASA